MIPANLDEALKKLAQPNLGETERWATLSLILREYALAYGIDLAMPIVRTPPPPTGPIGKALIWMGIRE